MKKNKATDDFKKRKHLHIFHMSQSLDIRIVVINNSIILNLLVLQKVYELRKYFLFLILQLSLRY